MFVYLMFVSVDVTARTCDRLKNELFSLKITIFLLNQKILMSPHK